MRRKALGEEHLDVALSLSNLGTLYARQKKYEAAEPLLKRALAIREQVLGPEHAVSLSSLANLARFYRIRGEFLRSGEFYGQVVARSERKLGSNHPGVVTALKDWASMLRQAKQNGPAKEIERRVQTIHTLQQQEHRGGPPLALMQ